ncbi:unnamed protein product [Pieris macdunnoughi]|uniref:Reverse transcriptase domain-containing protein n=1 Tax=Pieris macdunnoughi TaxID=345717 RepID=A0A821LI00_9NEOP|nr:unnamed protein product [Pieris macdunnoughi]
MQASPKLKEAYDNVISEYLNKGYISPAPLDTEETRNLPSYTIPHHGIIREDKLTSKLRIVLDCSSKFSSQISLNDILYNGQNLQGNLFHIIVNFRLFRIALSADIRQMFLSIGVRPCDRRFQRILYRFSSQEPLKVYEFNRVFFGLKSSPFHALRTIKQLVLNECASYPRAQQTVNTGLYMDDFVYSIDNEYEAISTAAEVIALMKAGQFDLVKWTSNSQRVLDSITPSHRLSAVKEFDDSDSHKVLGLCWSPATDNFSLKICTTAESCTNIFSDLATLVVGCKSPSTRLTNNGKQLTANSKHGRVDGCLSLFACLCSCWAVFGIGVGLSCQIKGCLANSLLRIHTFGSDQYARELAGGGRIYLLHFRWRAKRKKCLIGAPTILTFLSNF